MKIRHTTEGEKIEIQMTPMIDIVFQLLIFFIMTFKIVTMEGDFNIKMPLGASQGSSSDLLPPMKLRLRAGAGGELAGIALNEQSFGSWDELHNHIISVIGTESGPGSIQDLAEVEIDADYELRYTHVIAAITAVSGYIGGDGEVVKLVEKIKFTPPPANAP